MGTTTRRKLTGPELEDATLDDALVSLVARFPDGLELSKLRTALPPMYRVAKPRLDARVALLAAAGRVYRWGKRAVGPGELAARAAVVIEESLSEGPRTAKQLEASLPPVIRKEKALTKKVLEEHIRAGRVFELPGPRGGRVGLRYSRSRAEAAQYLGPIEKVLGELAKKLARAGVDRAALIRALAAELPETGQARSAGVSSAEDAHDGAEQSARERDRRAFFDAVLSVRPDARLHVLVSIPQLRARLAWPKAALDELALTLAREGQITLHEHDHPSGLAAEERAALVADEGGRHYIGLVLEEKA